MFKRCIRVRKCIPNHFDHICTLYLYITKFSLKLDDIEAIWGFALKYLREIYTTNPEKRLDVPNGKNWRKISAFRGLCDQVVNTVAPCFADIRWNER